jgi:Flp pilus assembly protein TadB
LQNGSLKIDPAWSWCKLSKKEQLEEFARYEEKRTQRKILREFSPRQSSASHQLSEVVEAVQRVEARNPGSIIIRSGRSKRTVLILGEDSLAALERIEGDRLPCL